jgi:dihydroorotate dehydrogenase
MYQTVIRPLLFRFDPERSHDAALACLAALGPLFRFAPDPSSIRDLGLEIQVAGLRFPTPVGLAAGLDKAARALCAWPALGFGFVEIGTVTALPQPGNPRPRVFRLPEDEALINRLGFNSPGAAMVGRRLARLARRYPIPLGVNIGRNAHVPNDAAVENYLAALEQLHRYADFLVVNISSPNTPGLRLLQGQDLFAPLLERLAQRNRALGEKPLLVKVSPDLGEADLEGLVQELPGRAHGIVATNTTILRDGLRDPAGGEAGGVSGRPLRDLSTRAIRILRRLTRGTLPIVGVGGVFTAEDAYEKIKAGASLVELYTGFVYGGPRTPRRVARGLRRLLDRDGFRTVSEAVGVESG